MLFFLHHYELPHLDEDRHQAHPAPVNLHLPPIVPLPPPPPIDETEGEDIAQTQVATPQESQSGGNQLSDHENLSNSSSSVEERNEDPLLRLQLHNTSLRTPSHDQSGPSQPLTEEEIRRIRLRHFERRRE